MAKKAIWIPKWSEEAPKENSYRAIFKWGNPVGFKHPNHKMYKYMKDQFNLSDVDFMEKKSTGDELINLKKFPSKIKEKDLKAFIKIVGDENVSSEDFDRLKYSTGKTQEEAFELRAEIIKKVTDLVVFPTSTDDVVEIVKYCDKNKIAINCYGGGSSVNFGFRPMNGGITLVLSKHMNKLLDLNEADKTATVEAGMMGPSYEELLNNAVTKLNCKKNYTNGHFPQSFEYSTVGGWVATLGSGQESSYYGDAGDLVLGVEFVSTKGVIITKHYPACATGPKILEIIKGSEGTFGIITKLVMKVFNYSPKTQYGFSYIFKSFEDGVAACKEISQGEFGFPGVMRISDEEESDMGLRLYGVSGTVLDWLMKLFGYKEMKRALFLGQTCGEKGFSKNVLKKAKAICRKHGGLTLTSYPVKKWNKSRYEDPYLREDLNDFNMILDTLETSVNWSQLSKVHQSVRAVVKSRKLTGCLTHASHFYPEGTNLYFIFFCKIKDLKDYVDLQTEIIDAIAKSGGALSHHHGVGRMIAPWMEEHLGVNQLNVLKELKKYFDPNDIFNPKGQLGVDYDAKKIKNYEWRGLK